MAELEVNLYEMNKQIMSAREPLTERKLKDEIAGIATWFSYEKDRYFMLLCHERRDYTLFHFDGKKGHYYEASQEVQEVLQERGEVLDIAYENKSVYAIWVKIEGEAFLYYLFPYDAGVIEV